MRHERNPIFLTILIAGLATFGAGGCGSGRGAAAGRGTASGRAEAAFVDGLHAEAAGDPRRASGLYRRTCRRRRVPPGRGAAPPRHD